MQLGHTTLFCLFLLILFITSLSDIRVTQFLMQYKEALLPLTYV
ncbi:hypothetical protein PORCRE_475 [Porphyromonas crevioricanis JCM 15906]|uniref:Uncharacterized protein n=1 Tax=Porphyromonas crevioricanis JCM 15906 TaxID=1305617 RepID=T1DRB8_9PORP|nr:hypothetical protein PORCRE_475 [Porphyromonas crevioricanis JCM 15906]